MILKGENQGLLSSISFSLVYLLLSKSLDAKPKSWLHPMFPSQETVLVIETEIGPFILIHGMQVRFLFVLHLGSVLSNPGRKSGYNSLLWSLGLPFWF